MLKTLYNAVRYETPFSLFVALTRSTQDKDIRLLSYRVFSQGTHLLDTLPFRLARFCTLTEGFYGSPMELLLNRTTYPLYLGCMTTEDAEHLARAVTDDGGPCRPRGTIPPTQLGNTNRYGLECKECTKVSRRETGRRCSLVFHCIPFQTRCPLHDCVYTLANACSAYEFKMITAANGSRHLNSTKLSRTLFRLLDAKTSESSICKIQWLLLKHGYIGEDGTMRSAELSRDFKAFWSDGFEDARMDCLVRMGNTVVNFLRRMQNNKTACHFLQVALLETALCEIERSRAPTALRTFRDRGRHAEAASKQTAQNSASGSAATNSPVIRP